MAFILLKHQSIFELSIELTRSHSIYDNFVLGNGTGVGLNGFVYYPVNYNYIVGRRKLN